MFYSTQCGRIKGEVIAVDIGQMWGNTSRFIVISMGKMRGNTRYNNMQYRSDMG